jgi:excisionase family DNA binding protein
MPTGRKFQTKKFLKMVDKDFLDSHGAASYLGISLDQLYKLNSGGKILSYRPTGGKVYYLKSDLFEWVLAGRRATMKGTQRRAIHSLTAKI